MGRRVRGEHSLGSGPHKGVPKEPGAEGKDGKPRAQRGREEETAGGAGWQVGE